MIEDDWLCPCLSAHTWTVNVMYVAVKANLFLCWLALGYFLKKFQDWKVNNIDWLTLFILLQRWLPLRFSKRQSPATMFRTTLTRTVTQKVLHLSVFNSTYNMMFLRYFFRFKENNNSTESSTINNDDIWKTRMREVRFKKTRLTWTYSYFVADSNIVIIILIFIFSMLLLVTSQSM